MVAEWLGIARDILTALSAIGVAIIALVGLTTWQRELRGRAKLEVARRVTLATFKVKDGFDGSRNPFMSTGEMAERKRDASESPEEAHLLDLSYVHGRRLQVLAQNLQELRLAVWEADVVIDPEARSQLRKDVEDLVKKYIELRAAVETYYHLQQGELRLPPGRRPLTEENRKVLQDMEKFVCHQGKDDAFEKATATSVDALLSLMQKQVPTG